MIGYPALVAAAAGAVAFMTVMPGRSFRGPLAPATPAQVALAGELHRDVVALAGDGSRNAGRPGSLARAEALVARALAASGLSVRRLPYAVDGVEGVNVEATREGRAKPGEIVVVGAHYDTVAETPGADDDASGVAALLAIARATAGDAPARTVRFVAFANEEPPYFWNAPMGSLVYAKACRARGDRVVAMLSLETLGYYRTEPGTQKYPPVVSALYPDRGDFVAFVGNVSSRGLTRAAVRAFRESEAFPSEGAALPSFVAGVGWSDHWSFWQAGYAAVMVTDTAPFRNPSYHEPTDTPETLDYDRFARAVEGVTAVVRRMANE